MRNPIAIMVRTLDSDGRWVDHEVKYEDAFHASIKRAVVAALCGFVKEDEVNWPIEGTEDESLLDTMSESVTEDDTVTGWWTFVIGEGTHRRHALVWQIWN